MNALIIFCHPEPASFTGAMKDTAVETLQRMGYDVEVSDLHGEGFDPVEKSDHYSMRWDPDRFSSMDEQRYASKNDAIPDDVCREIDRLERADLVVLQFPLWWHSQPAMLKGWFDRVFINGRLYSSKMRYDHGYFRGKKAMCSVSVGAPETAFGSNGRGGDLEAMFWSIHYSLYYMGFTVLPPHFAFGIQNYAGVIMNDSEFMQHLESKKTEWSRVLENFDHLEPLSFPGWDEWDENGNPRSSEVQEESVAS